MDPQKLLDLALAAGAHKAAAMEQSHIRLSESFRALCEANTCGSYGKCWMCPPFIGPVEERMEEIRSYPHAVMFQTIWELEDSYDLEAMEEGARKHARAAMALREAAGTVLKNKFLVLSCGGCNLCEQCAKITEEPCRFPDKALSSVEGYGVDVYRTVKGTELKYINGADTVTYFGMILYTE